LLLRTSRGLLVAILLAIALWVLNFYGLTRVGLIGRDEPRYAAIGRTMSDSGDWITPRLWMQPWFEKPALIYWMTAAGFRAGLGAESAPRLPVALVSVAFLVCFFLILRNQFGQRAALFAALVLATSAGWIAYSHVAVPDLPMSALFSSAMLILASAKLTPRRVVAAGVLLGLAILAKGLVPLVLFLPALWFLRKQAVSAAAVLGIGLAAAAPWYLLVLARNGSAFLDVFFAQQQFARFYSGKFLHVQPFWYYVPVLAAGVFPWTPLALLLFSRRLYQDHRVRFLLLWFAFGFVFFSASRGKLPGYLLPVLPAFAALIGIAVERARERSLLIACAIAASAALLYLVPTAQDALPQALVSGLGRAPVHFFWSWLVPAIAVATLCGYLEMRSRRQASFAMVAAFTALLIANFIWRDSSLLDQVVSGRALWLTAPRPVTCIPHDRQYVRYSLDYYVGRELPDCK
jgi:4-amino-4-deoxy-L-arabinose transferase-like glycosyltransferase